MPFQYSPAVFLMLAAGTVSLYLTYLGWRIRKTPIARPFILLMAAETVWIFGYALELMSTSLTTVLIINDIEYPAVSTVPVAWLFIVLFYTGRGQYLTRKTVPLFFVIPALVWILVLTNPWHSLFYSGFHQQVLDGSVIWIYEHGPLFWIHIGYCYILAVVALVLAAGRLFVSTELYRRQMILLFCAACIPALFNMAYVFGLAPFPSYDLTPVSFLLAGILLAVGLLRYQLFSAVPVAYSYVFSTMRDGVIVTNGEYRVIDLNPAAELITGMSSHDVIGSSLARVFPGLAAIGSVPVQEGKERRIEITAIPGGEPRIYEVTVTPMGTEGTISFGYICLFRDITGRKEAELALAEANRKIGLLTSITRHDLTNKLMAVYSYLELVRDLSTDPLQKEYIDKEEAAINAMSEQLEFTKEYQQLGTKVPVWQDPVAVVDRAKTHVDFKNVSLKVSTGPFRILADPMLEKVFSNLFDNAVKYGGDGITSIAVASHTAGTGLVITVEDDGAGISEQDKPLLFERGFGKHTGLGLFLSREILAITNIAIRETSEPGRGARFEITVPAGKFRPAGNGCDGS